MRFLPFLLAAHALAQAPGWPTYGNDPGGSRYSPAAQIHRGNVRQLRLAWTHHTGGVRTPGAARDKSAFEATPILVDGLLVLSTPTNRILALDPETGRERWAFDPKVDESARYSEVTSRGVAHWRGPNADAPCNSRILAGTIDARLLAVDARTGLRCAGFGKDGEVDLTGGVRVRDRGQFQVTSPPAVVRDVVVVGSAIGDNRAVDVERGTVRAYDARTGALRWSWDPLPPGQTGGANAWGVMAADPERDLVFIPTGSASPDFYGGERPGDNRHANSVVALRASTGKVVWGFQVVHHDLWDYDVAAQPSLFTFRQDGRGVPAVLVSTKMGHAFVLHRETGQPLSPVEERAVPASDVPGEAAAKTQPFPARMAALVPQSLRPEEAWGATPEEKAWCREQLSAVRNEGLYTPPSVRGALAFPGNVGGVAWGGASVDGERGVMVANTNRLPFILRLIPRSSLDSERKNTGENRLGGEFGTQSGTPYAIWRAPLLTAQRRPCNAPPWGALTALDLQTGRKRWEVPLGEMPGPDGKLAPVGAPNLGGPIVTAGGLVFIAATMDPKLRAFDLETGEVVWQADLPTSAHATPMTYMAGGKQYVVVCAGGHGKLGTALGDSVVAFALP